MNIDNKNIFHDPDVFDNDENSSKSIKNESLDNASITNNFSDSVKREDEKNIENTVKKNKNSFLKRSHIKSKNKNSDVAIFIGATVIGLLMILYFSGVFDDLSQTDERQFQQDTLQTTDVKTIEFFTSNDKQEEIDTDITLIQKQLNEIQDQLSNMKTSIDILEKNAQETISALTSKEKEVLSKNVEIKNLKNQLDKSIISHKKTVLNKKMFSSTKTLTGYKLHSIYAGQAWVLDIGKNKVVVVTEGEHIDNNRVIKIEASGRKIYTTLGIIN
ncbi:hypothetical protein ABLA30_03920 [Xenorhabdus nematophila]|uniref:hypothetical protein n=1 Tax=Xenorhabdus nematophila TaxID=628 RepID=UPI0032B857C4